MKVVESDLSLDHAVLCQMAILDPAPYQSWTADMRKMIGGEVRNIQFTFYFGSELPKQD